MTVSELISEVKAHNPGTHFFDRDTLKFFGERISEMRVLKDTEENVAYDGKKHTCYVLSTLQRKSPGGVRRVYHYFGVGTFEEYHRKED